ncbi:hypothetical protein BV20DRAFT_975644 [Pilatotrama ljubarskyi]|nr:hypothetical protein BV20DRAFT_975644 [Pilatotrama ljubarskyi]
MPSLPAEITDIIIDCLADDWRSLAACALVCSEWRVRAGYHLSRGVTLLLGNPKSTPDLFDFVRLFCARPELSDLIVSLAIQGAVRSPNCACGDLPDDVDLSPLRNLRSLTLSNLYVSTAARFRTLYTSFPLLQELSIDDVLTKLEEIPASSAPADGVQSGSERQGAYPPLRTLRMKVTHSELETVSDVLRDDLLTVPCLAATLRSLKLDLPRGYTGQWAQTLAVLQGSLHELRVRVWAPPVGSRAGLYGPIGGYTRLRSLTVHVSTGILLPHSEIPLVCTPLAQWLTSPACLFARTLERFTLCLPYPASEIARRSEAFAAVGRALGAERFPSLAHLRINILDRGEPDGLEEQRKGPEEQRKELEEQRKGLEELFAMARRGQRDGGSAVVEVCLVQHRHEWTKKCM